MTIEQGDQIIVILRAIEGDIRYIRREIASQIVQLDRILGIRLIGTEH